MVNELFVAQEQRIAQITRMFLLRDLVQPAVPDQLVLPPELLGANPTLERLHPRMGHDVPVELPLLGERFHADVARQGAVDRVHCHVGVKAVGREEPLFAAQARVAFYRGV